MDHSRRADTYAVPPGIPALPLTNATFGDTSSAADPEGAFPVRVDPRPGTSSSDSCTVESASACAIPAIPMLPSTVSPHDAKALLAAQIQATQDLLGWPSGAASATVVLRHYGWNADAFSDLYGRRAAAALSAALGSAHPAVVPGAVPAQDVFVLCSGSVYCEQCARTVPDAYALQCGHALCQTCWRCHVGPALKKSEAGEPLALLGLTCPHRGCRVPVAHDVSLSLLYDGEERTAVVGTYHAAVFHAFVRECATLRPCAAAECSLYVLHPMARRGGPATEVTCCCGESFCFACGGAPHPPAPCRDESSEQCRNLDFHLNTPHTQNSRTSTRRDKLAASLPDRGTNVVAEEEPSRWKPWLISVVVVGFLIVLGALLGAMVATRN